MKKISVKRDICEKYTLRWKDKPWWAIFVIDENGMFNVQSDFGSYQYFWNSIGDQTFKHFLTTLDNSYLMTKLGGRRDYFNGDATKKAIRDRVKEIARESGSAPGMEVIRFFEGTGVS